MNKFCVPNHIKSVYFDNTTVLLDLKTNTYYALNDSGAEFWKSLINSDSVDSAIDKILELYDELPNVIQQDFENFIEVLFTANLLVKIN